VPPARSTALSSPADPPKVAVVGGSLGGMMAALALRGAGCSVDVYERVPHRLEAQGAGLRIVPEMADLLQRRAGIDLEAVCTRTQWFRHIGPDNRIVSDQLLPGLFTSWGSLHRALTSAFDASRYHLGHDCTGIAVQPDQASLEFADRKTIAAHLAVFADGILSTGRRLLAPDPRRRSPMPDT
jgi:2,6-dihydroxypyridine 3-monooxygenase